MHCYFYYTPPRKKVNRFFVFIHFYVYAFLLSLYRTSVGRLLILFSSNSIKSPLHIPARKRVQKAI